MTACAKVGCDHKAKFRIGDAEVGYDTCGRHLAYFAQHMSGPTPQEWVPVAPVGKP